MKGFIVIWVLLNLGIKEIKGISPQFNLGHQHPGTSDGSISGWNLKNKKRTVFLSLACLFPLDMSFYFTQS